MKYRDLSIEDLPKYAQDIKSCYDSNSLILDSQNPLNLSDEQSLVNFIGGFIDSEDSTVVGLFDDNEKFLYGLVIFDSIRFGQDCKVSAELHLAIDKKAYGRLTFELLQKLRDESIFTTLYCHIPDIAVRTIGLCKRMGFKKTGYIPNCLPYINLAGIEELHDVQIWTYNKPDIRDILLEEELPF